MKDLAPLRDERGKWLKGQSPNPGGKPARMGELLAMAQTTFPAAIKRLAELIESKDDDMAFKAISLAFFYVLGKPPENRELLVAEQMRARLTELVAVPAIATVSAPAASSPPSPPEQAEAPPPSLPPDTGVPTPPKAAAQEERPASAPSGLRCLYRGKEGRCESAALDGSQWCEPHRTKLFQSVDA